MYLSPSMIISQPSSDLIKVGPVKKKYIYIYIYLIKIVPVTQSCVPSHEPLSHVRLQGGRVCLQSQSSSSVSSWSLSYITTIISSLSLLVITVVHQCDDSSVEALEAATVVLHKGLGQISKGENVLGGGLERLGHGNIAQNFRSNLKRWKLLGGGLERYNELLYIFKRVSFFSGKYAVSCWFQGRISTFKATNLMAKQHSCVYKR